MAARSMAAGTEVAYRRRLRRIQQHLQPSYDGDLQRASARRVDPTVNPAALITMVLQ